MKRARQGFGKQIGGVVLILLVTMPLLLGGLYITALVFDKLRIELYWPGIMSMATVKWALIAIPSMGIGPACGYIVRDWLLRRWIKRILSVQGVCPSCSYNLLGLPLDENSAVQCPECGLKSVVDPSLGELKLDEKGRPIAILDGKRMVRKSNPWLWKWTKRALIAAAIFVFVILPGAAGIWEYSIRSQANRATADLALLHQAAKDLIVKNQTAPAGPSVWPPLARAGRNTSQVIASFQSRFGSDLYGQLELERISPLDSSRRRAEEDAAQYRVNTRSAPFRPLTFIAALKADGVLDDLDAAAGNACTLPWDDVTAAVPINSTLATTGLVSFYPQEAFTNAYWLQVASLGRFSVAARAGDLPLAVRGLREALAVNRAMASIPARHYGRYEGTGLRWATDSLLLNPSPEWVAALRAEFKNQWPTESDDDWIEGERIHALAFVADYFSRPERSRYGSYSPAFTAMKKMYSGGTVSNAKLGTYRENVDLINDYFDAVKAHVEAGNSASSFVWLNAGPQLPFFVGIWTQGHTWQTRIESQRRAMRDGFTIVGAIVEFKAANGRLPSDLAELSPKFLPQPLLDPFSSKPFFYSITASDRDGSPIRFRLLSVGPNGTPEMLKPGSTLLPSWSYTDDIIIVDGYDDLP